MIFLDVWTQFSIFNICQRLKKLYILPLNIKTSSAYDAFMQSKHLQIETVLRREIMFFAKR